MSNSICGADCAACYLRENCKGCRETNGCPFGKQCFVAKLINDGGAENYGNFKQKLKDKFNSLDIPEITKINDLYPLLGKFINLGYPLPNGRTVPFLDDCEIYLGNQVQTDSGRCLGLVAGEHFLLVCEYEENGIDPQIIIYKKI